MLVSEETLGKYNEKELDDYLRKLKTNINLIEKIKRNYYHKINNFIFYMDDDQAKQFIIGGKIIYLDNDFGLCMVKDGSIDYCSRVTATKLKRCENYFKDIPNHSWFLSCHSEDLHFCKDVVTNYYLKINNNSFLGVETDVSFGINMKKLTLSHFDSEHEFWKII